MFANVTMTARIAGGSDGHNSTTRARSALGVKAVAVAVLLLPVLLPPGGTCGIPWES